MCCSATANFGLRENWLVRVWQFEVCRSTSCMGCARAPSALLYVGVCIHHCKTLHMSLFAYVALCICNSLRMSLRGRLSLCSFSSLLLSLSLSMLLLLLLLRMPQGLSVCVNVHSGCCICQVWHAGPSLHALCMHARIAGVLRCLVLNFLVRQA